MSLIDLQRDVQAVCLDREVDEQRLSRLGDERVFRIYRDMVRRRVYGELKIALPRSCLAAGEAAFDTAFATFMTERPPRRRFFHDVPVEFAEVAEPLFRKGGTAKPYAADMMLYESACWKVSDMPADVPEAFELTEFDFELPTVLHPTVRLLALEYPVHIHHEDEREYVKKPTPVVLYRPDDADRVRYLSVSARGYAVLMHVHTHGCTMTEAIKQVSQAQHFAVDQSFLEKFCALLADLVDRRVILGSWARS